MTTPATSHDPSGNGVTPEDGVFPALPAPTSSRDPKALEIVEVLDGYKFEAENARRGGLNNRDLKWEDNLNLYWNRFNFAGKADWQSQETMPEVPAHVDRFAGALKEALIADPNGFYDIEDPTDTEADLANAVKSITDQWLGMCGRNQMGRCLPFPAVFEEQVKLGALMGMSSVVLWKDDYKYGRVAIETVDPRMTWLDHTYRNLYRIRRIEIDKHELKALARMTDKKGRPLYNLGEIDALTTQLLQDDLRRKEELTGTGQFITSTREPVVLEEYLATVVANDGSVLADRALMVVANGRYLIRGPEKNPFWHDQDWYNFTPLITVPFSVYGRTYMEDFGSIAQTFNELTNLILDGVRTSSMKAFAVVPSMLVNGQDASSIYPNKIFELEEGAIPEHFLKEIDLGNMPDQTFQLWTALKQELREAAGLNEIGMGQFAPKGRTAAAEISAVQQNSAAVVRSIAQTIEDRWLSPTLDTVWRTGLQHASAGDKGLQAAAGKEMWGALISRRKELVKRPITFRASGISALMAKSRTLQSLVSIMGVIASNQMLLAAFLKVADMTRLVKLLFDLSNVDLRKLEPTERERMVSAVTQPLMQAGQQAAEATAGQEPSPVMQQGAEAMAQALGVGRSSQGAQVAI